MELDYISVDSVTKWCDIVWARNASNKSGSCVNIKSTKCSTQSNNSIWIKEKKLYICVPQHFVTTESDNIGGQSVLFNQWITNKFVHAHRQSQLKHRDASQEQRRNWIRRKNQSVVQRKLWLRLAYVSHARVVTRISRWRNSVREQQFLVVPHDYLWIRKMCVFICQKRVAPMCTLRYKNIHKCAGFGYEANDSCRSDGVVLVRAIRSHRHPRLWMRCTHTLAPNFIHRLRLSPESTPLWTYQQNESKNKPIKDVYTWFGCGVSKCDRRNRCGRARWMCKFNF